MNDLEKLQTDELLSKYEKAVVIAGTRNKMEEKRKSEELLQPLRLEVIRRCEGMSPYKETFADVPGPERFA